MSSSSAAKIRDVSFSEARVGNISQISIGSLLLLLVTGATTSVISPGNILALKGNKRLAY
jgi:hypothetical protein